LNERRGNVIENKGQLWKKWEKAGMSLKTKALSPSNWYVIENTGS
jgi:hypothetical protein